MSSLGASVIVGIVNGIISRRKLDQWARLLLSCHISGVVTFSIVMGGAIVVHIAAGYRPSVALVLAFGEGLIARAAIVFYLCRRSPLTKGMLFVVPRSADRAAQTILEKEGVVIIEK